MTEPTERAQIALPNSPHQPANAPAVASNVNEPEEEIKKSEARFRALVDATAQVVWTADAGGAIVEDSPSWRAFTGQTFEEMKGYGWLGALHPDDRDGAESAWRKASAEQSSYEAEYRLRRANGDWRWTVARGVPLNDSAGRPVGWVGMNSDVTERKAFEDALKESEATLKAILEQLPVGVVIADVNGQVTTANEALRELWGMFKIAKMSEYGEFEAYRLEDGARIEGEGWAIARALLRGETTLNELARIKTFDGKEKIVANSSKPIYLESGRLVGAIAVAQDITAQKAHELEMIRAREAAESANKMKSAFLANMSHEIRTPLGAILGFTELLKDPAIEQEEKDSYLEIIERNGLQLTSIINDILDLSKIEAGQISLETLRVSPRDAIKEVAASLRVRADSKKIALAVQFSESVPEFVGTDPTRFKQVVSNILGNAIKFTNLGGVRCDVRYERNADGGALIAEVSDTGVGIAPEQQERLFKAFSQADESMTRRFGGTGLGLALSRKLAETLGGDVELVRSSPEQGSTFRIKVEDRLSKVASS